MSVMMAVIWLKSLWIDWKIELMWHFYVGFDFWQSVHRSVVGNSEKGEPVERRWLIVVAQVKSRQKSMICQWRNRTDFGDFSREMAVWKAWFWCPASSECDGSGWSSRWWQERILIVVDSSCCHGLRFLLDFFYILFCFWFFQVKPNKKKWKGRLLRAIKNHALSFDTKLM